MPCNALQMTSANSSRRSLSGGKQLTNSSKQARSGGGVSALANFKSVGRMKVGARIIFIGARAFGAPQAAAGFGIPGTPTEDRNFQA